MTNTPKSYILKLILVNNVLKTEFMNMNISIKKLRKLKKISQQELAKKLYLSQRTISSYENGEREPSLETIVKLAEILNCSIEEVVYALIESKRNATKNKSEVI